MNNLERYSELMTCETVAPPSETVSSKQMELRGILLDCNEIAVSMQNTLFGSAQGDPCKKEPTCLLENVQINIENALVLRKALEHMRTII